MKNALVLVLALLLSMPAAAQESGAEEVLASRGKAAVTQAEFDARMAEIPARDRASFLRDRERLERTLANMLLLEQLAEEARAVGFDHNEMTQAQMALAAQNELAKSWLEHYLDGRDDADFETLAHEYYTLNPAEFMTEQTVDVSHILISKDVRSVDEAKALAEDLVAQLRQDPGQFDAFIQQYSEDSGKPGNGGHYRSVERGDMVKPFEEAAFSLPVGVISDPVYSVYGYHILRVDAVQEARPRSFEEVKSVLIERERKKHRDRVRKDYLESLAKQDVQMTEEALKKMLSRYFSEEALAFPVEESTD